MTTEERLKKLEKEVTRLTKALEKVQKDSSFEKVHKEIRANNFKVIDEKGKERIVFSAYKDDSVVMVMGKNGKPCIVLGERYLAIRDKADNDRIVLAEESIVLYDKDKNIRAMLDENGLILKDRNGKVRLLLATDQIVLYDENGKARALLLTNRQGEPSLNLLNATEKDFVRMEVNHDSSNLSLGFENGNYTAVEAGEELASFTLYDKKRKLRIKI